jgi:hypothetical protein
MDYSVEMTPAQKHYANVKKAVQKYQSNNRDKLREASKQWREQLKMDAEKYAEYLANQRIKAKINRIQKRLQQEGILAVV